MLKKTSTDKVSLGVRCGDCVHFQRGPSKFEKTCNKLGVDAKSKAPDCFSPDVFRLNAGGSPELLGQLGRLIRDLTPGQSRILSHLLSKNGNAIHKQGFRFGQPVYFTLGHDYLSHYFKGYVIGACDDYVYVASKLNKARSNTSVTFMAQSLLSYKQYKEKEKKLLKSKKIFMSEKDKALVKKLPLAEHIDREGCVKLPEQVELEYEPPTLDTAPAAWFNIYENSIQSKLRKKKPKGKKAKLGDGKFTGDENYTRVGGMKARVIRSKS